MPGKCEINLKPDATHAVHPPRRVPVALRDKLKAELDRMESEQITANKFQPIDWVKSLVTVEKSNGGLRVCLDPKYVNDAIKRSRYPHKTLDDILPDQCVFKV